MVDYHLTHKAVADLANIWDYTCSKWSETQADKYYRQLLEMCREIARFPGLGRNYNWVMLHLRGAYVGRHIVFYRVVPGNPIEITRILHERMDVKKAMTE